MENELLKALKLYEKGKLSDEEFDMLVELITSDFIDKCTQNNKKE